VIDLQRLRPLALDSDAVRGMLPHRPPLLLVDGVDGISSEPPALRAHKVLTASEPVFAGHFPQRPIWPGIYTVEGLAQTCALLGALQAAERGETSAPLNAALAAANVKFTAPVLPGERIDYLVMWTFRLDSMHRFDVEASVAGRIVAKGILTLVVAPA
jgi:3-hydroxyacyl-[acyl-carrier-protein] dehydratase